MARPPFRPLTSNFRRVTVPRRRIVLLQSSFLLLLSRMSFSVVSDIQLCIPGSICKHAIYLSLLKLFLGPTFPAS